MKKKLPPEWLLNTRAAPLVVSRARVTVQLPAAPPHADA
jgi:hypothetical protein